MSRKIRSLCCGIRRVCCFRERMWRKLSWFVWCRQVQTYSHSCGSRVRNFFIAFQCGLFGSCHGLYMFFPEIVDKITTYSKQFPSGRATICEVLLKDDELMLNRTVHSIALRQAPECSETFEISTFGHSIVMEMLYMVGFFVITLIINRVSKLSILTTILFGCATFGFATEFITVPIASIYFYVAFMLTFLAVNVVNAVTVDLFPTNLRWVRSMIIAKFSNLTFLVEWQ